MQSFTWKLEKKGTVDVSGMMTRLLTDSFSLGCTITDINCVSYCYYLFLCYCLYIRYLYLYLFYAWEVCSCHSVTVATHLWLKGAHKMVFLFG